MPTSANKKRRGSAPVSSSAASLSESARRYSTGSASGTQSIADQSPQVANARRNSQELLLNRGSQPVSRNQPDESGTTERIGSRNVRRATASDTKWKYSILGFKFGRVTTFSTEDITLPAYKENDREKRYFSAVKKETASKIKKGGFKTMFGGSGSGSVSTPQNVGQYNSRGHIYFFNSELNAKVYGKTNVDGDYAIIEFVMPADHEFTPDPESGFGMKKLSKTQAMRTAEDIPAQCIKQVHYYDRVRKKR